MASTFRQRYTMKDANAKTDRKQSASWYVDFKTADGTRKRVKGFREKGGVKAAMDLWLRRVSSYRCSSVLICPELTCPDPNLLFF